MDAPAPTLGGAELRRRAVKSTAWFGVTRIGVQLSSWVVTIVLARFLTPGDYGLFAMALSVLAFLEIFQEFGLGSAVIQREHITREQINGVFWVVVGGSMMLTTGLFVAADFVGALYAEPRLPVLLKVLGIAFLLNSLGMVPQTLLTKEIYLDRRSLADAAGLIVAIPVALGLAYTGHGVWALVLAHVARAAARNTVLAVVAGWMPGVTITVHGMRDILKFGLQVVGGHVIGTISNAVNTAILGRLLGGHAVGLYSMGRSLAEGPHRISTSVINQVSFPVFSKVQADPASLRRSFLTISKYLAIVSLPVQVGMALVAADLVPVVLSPNWNEMIGVLQVFALGFVTVVLSLPVNPLLNARGRPDIVVRFLGVWSAVMALALLGGAAFGLFGAVVAWLLVEVPGRWMLVLIGLREIGLSLRDYSRHLRSPALATGGMTLAVLGLDGMLPAEIPLLIQVTLKVAAAALVYAALLLVLDRRLTSDIRSMARDLFATARA